MKGVLAQNLYIGIDLGTTGIKVALFDPSGTMISTAYREIQLNTPMPGFLEFDGEERKGESAGKTKKSTNPSHEKVDS